MTEQQMIEFWKSNEKPFGLCPKEAQEWLRCGSRFGECAIYNPSGKWEDVLPQTSICPHRVYRLPADYQPKKTGRWVECGVFVNTDGAHARFRFRRDTFVYSLHEAPGMVGFGGVRYFSQGLWCDLGYYADRSEKEKPMKPEAVRFWVEE